jgi:hypothetical protein
LYRCDASKQSDFNHALGAMPLTNPQTALNDPAPGCPSLPMLVIRAASHRIMHHDRLLKFEGKSYRLKEAAEKVAKRAVSA